MGVALVNIVICLSFVEVFSILWQETKIANYPFLVSLQNRVSGHVCTGTLVEASWVLTNDYCSSILYSHKDTIIVAGQTDINAPLLSNRKTEIRKPNYHKKHYQVAGKGSKHALSLYHFKKPFKLGRNIQVAKLPDGTLKELDSRTGQRCRIIGWGKAENESKKTFKLWTASVSLIPVKTCKRINENVTLGYSLCINSADNFFTMVGQSGSPLICDGIVVGVMYQTECTSHDACIYTRTDSNMIWIRGSASSYNNLLFTILTYILMEICTIILS